MINSLDGIAALLRGTELETSTKVELEIPESSNCAFAIKVNGQNTLRSWSIFRSLVEITERYPVLVGNGLFPGIDWIHYLKELVFSRTGFHSELSNSEDKNCSPEAIIARYNRINLEQEIEQYQRANSGLSLAQATDLGIRYTLAKFGIAPSREAISASFQSHLDSVTDSVVVKIENWLFDWEGRHLAPEIALAPPDLEDLYLSWYEPEDTLDYTIVLLPTANSWEALAYIHFFGARSSEVMMALLQSWHKRFKAELVAHDGLNLLFNVHRQPSTPEEAFQLAVEHTTFAGDTLFFPDISIRDYARALLHIDRWCLLSKP